MSHVVGIGGCLILAYLVTTTDLGAYPVPVLMMCAGIFIIAMSLRKPGQP